MFGFRGQHFVNCELGIGVQGLGIGVWSVGFGVWGLGFGVWGSGFTALLQKFWPLRVQRTCWMRELGCDLEKGVLEFRF